MKTQTSTQPPNCQIGQLSQIHEQLTVFGRAWQFRNRLKRFVKRRLMFMSNLIDRKFTNRRVVVAQDIHVEPLKAGDWVQVRSKDEIHATLGDWNYLKGCSFMDEMWQYCGTKQRVLKRVEHFLDERDYLLKKVRGIVILDRVNCQGTVDFGPCDRSCFFFWREEWLKKMEQ
jgi:hypothetical protein